MVEYEYCCKNDTVPKSNEEIMSVQTERINTMSNLERLKQRIAAEDLDAVLLLDSYNRHFATGFHSTAGAVIVTAEDAWFITDSRYIEAAEEAAAGRFHVLRHNAEHTMNDLIKTILAQNNVSKLGGESSRLNYEEYTAYEELLGIKLIGCQNMIDEIRAVKNEDELALMRKAQEITDEAFAYILTFIKPGMTERRVAAELVYQMMLRGADQVSFDPIVVAGHRSSMPHGVPTENVIQEGDFVTMDFGCMYRGYCSDMTRTVAVGHATEEMRKVYDTVLQAQLAGLAASKAGVLGKDVDKAARDVIEAAGYGEYFGHGYGHSLGLEIHEAPYASPKGNVPMPAGCVCSAEPGIYLPGKFGVRIEDTAIFREDGVEILTKSPKELIIV